MNASYEVALTLLGLSPAEFYRLTPAETTDMVLASRRRENHRIRQRSYELWMLLLPNLSERSQINDSTIALAYPGYVADGTEQAPPSRLTPEQKAERRRREAIPRVTRR